MTHLRLKEKNFDTQNFCIFGSKIVNTNDSLNTSLEILGATREIELLKEIKDQKALTSGLSARDAKQSVYQGLLLKGYKESEIKLLWDKNTIREYLTNLTNIYTITAFKTGENGTGRKVVFEKKVLDAEGNTRVTTTISKVNTFEKMDLRGLKVMRDPKDNEKFKDISKADLNVLNSIFEKIDQDRENGLSIVEIKDNANNAVNNAFELAKKRFLDAQNTSSAWDNFTITLADQQKVANEKIKQKQD